MIDRSKCEGCHLQDQEPVDTRTSGDDPGYMVVTEAPAAYNAQRGRLLSNNASKVLSRELASLGFDKDDFLFVPQIRCVFDPDTLPSKTKALIQKQCRAHLLDTIKEHRPDVIIPLGAEPSKQVHGRAVKITKVRGQAEYSVEHDAVVIPMLHPGYVAMYPQHYSVFKADCNTFARVVDNDLDIEAASNINAEDYHIITDLQFLIDMEPSLIFFDTETTGLEFFHKGPDNVRDYDPDIHGREFDPSAAILTMQFCVKSGTAYMLVWDHPEKPISLRNKAKIKKQLVQLFGRKKTRIIGQNSKFDANFVFETLGIRYEIGGDTLMLAALLDENMISKGQDVLVKHYVAEKAGYADTFNATYDKSRMWEVPLDAMIRYGCGDVDTGFMLYKVLIKKLLEDPLLTAQYRYVSLPGINTFADIEVNGIEVDDDALQAFQAIMEESVADQYQSLIAQVPRSIRKKHIDKGLAFSRPAFLLDILFEHRDGFRLRPKVFTKSTEKLQSDMRVPSVSTKDHLPYFFEECPFTEELATYIKDERLLTTSVKGFNKKYIHDGLVRPTYALWVTVTGRSSCVRGDTPVLTRNGTVRADCISVGDEVWTHAGRWMPVLELFDKPPTAMYSLSIENGEILTVTGQHELLLNSGVWATVDSLLESGEGDAINLQRGYEQSSASVEGSERVPEALTDGAAGSGYVRGESCNSEGYDSPSYTGFGIQQTEGHALPCEQARREKPSIRPRVGVRLRGWARVPDTASGREEILCSPDSGSGVSGPTPLSSTCDYGSTSHRRESQEQPYRQFGYSYRGGPSKDTRKVSASERGLAIEKVERAGVHRVYDFEVAEDHSYLACGVFNHNSENPNGQNFPKRGPNAKAYRRIFIAPRGWVVIEADLSQAELRIAADMANEQTMLRIYREGGDIHKSTALIVMGVSLEEFLALPKEEQKAARQKAKAVNFGFIYGMGWRKFIGYAKTQYGVEFSEQEAQRIREAFFSLYSGLTRWHEAMRAWAREHGYVRSYSGRIRHLPMIYSDDEGVQQEAGRQAINSPVQNFASDLGVIAISRMRKAIDPAYLKPIAFVHDAIYCYAREEYAMWGAETIKYYMESNPLEVMFNRRMKVPIVADVSVGRNFGDTYELEGFTSADEFDVGTLWNEDEKSGILLPKQIAPYKNGARQQHIYCTAD